MPYIDKENRNSLDKVINDVVESMPDAPFHERLGDLNYVLSRIVAGCMGKVSYGKIAMATGVLENVKQELYRRLASPYEDLKIEQNGDIPEYET